MRLYRFSLEGSCPHCGKQLDKPGSVLAVGCMAFVNDRGVVALDAETDLIHSNPDSDAICCYCNGKLPVEATEE